MTFFSSLMSGKASYKRTGRQRPVILSKHHRMPPIEMFQLCNPVFSEFKGRRFAPLYWNYSCALFYYLLSNVASHKR